jgi:hypothetical protein
MAKPNAALIAYLIFSVAAGSFVVVRASSYSAAKRLVN